jgi:hypothetical protein
MKKNQFVLTALMIGGLVCTGFGQVIGNFETPALDNWDTDGTYGTPPTLSQSAIGVTLGSYSLASKNAQGSYWGPATGNLITEGLIGSLETASTLSYSLTLDSVWLNGGSGSFNGYAQNNAMAINLYGGTVPTSYNFQEAFSTGSGDTDSSGQNATWNGVDGTRTISWNLSSFTVGGLTVAQVIAANGGVSAFSSAYVTFVQQTGGASAPVGGATFYFDNVLLTQPVPEPTTIALTGLGIAGLLGIRRKRNS